MVRLLSFSTVREDHGESLPLPSIHTLGELFAVMDYT